MPELRHTLPWQGERHVAVRPDHAPMDWRRVRPLVVVVDNYQAHKSDRVKAELSHLQAADIYLFYLPAYSPELSEIEPIWNDVKYHGLPQCSYQALGDLGFASKVARTGTSRNLICG